MKSGSHSMHTSDRLGNIRLGGADVDFHSRRTPAAHSFNKGLFYCSAAAETTGSAATSNVGERWMISADYRGMTLATETFAPNKKGDVGIHFITIFSSKKYS